MSRYRSYRPHICGCYYTDTVNNELQRMYLPQVKLDAHTTVFSIASKTVLKQTFVNTSKNKPLGEVRCVASLPLIGLQGCTFLHYIIRLGTYVCTERQG